MLNAPVGFREFWDASFTAKVRSLEQLLDDVVALENSHVSFTLLKFCLGVVTTDKELIEISTWGDGGC